MHWDTFSIVTFNCFYVLKKQSKNTNKNIYNNNWNFSWAPPSLSPLHPKSINPVHLLCCTSHQSALVYSAIAYYHYTIHLCSDRHFKCCERGRRAASIEKYWGLGNRFLLMINCSHNIIYSFRFSLKLYSLSWKGLSWATGND